MQKKAERVYKQAAGIVGRVVPSVCYTDIWNRCGGAYAAAYAVWRAATGRPYDNSIASVCGLYR